MKLILGIISLVFGLLSFATLAFFSWVIHSTLHQMAAAGQGDISPVVVGGLFPAAFLMALLGIFFGLYRMKRRSKAGRILSVAGVVSSVAAIVVIIFPYFFLP